MPNQTLDTQRWKARKGATDTRLALLLATAQQQAEAGFQTYLDRVKRLLGDNDYYRLIRAWQADQETPDDLHERIEADPELCRLWADSSRMDWLLAGISHNQIPSEHYVYQQTGKLRGPNGER